MALLRRRPSATDRVVDISDRVSDISDRSDVDPAGEARTGTHQDLDHGWIQFGGSHRLNVADDGLGPIRPLLDDRAVTEVLVNGPGPVWVERHGSLYRTDVTVTRQQLELLIERILAPLGLRVDRSSPIVDARMADGSRVNVVVPPLSIDGPSLSIRRFGTAAVCLPAFGPPDMAHVLTELMRNRASILVVGPTSSGKTTLINALSQQIDTAERVVCIEDTAELQLAVRNVVRLEARPANSEGVGEVPLRQLVLTALRMRPDRLVVGEVRGAEAFDLLLALTSGHRGCLTSCHAEDAASGLRRLETLASLAGPQLGHERLRRLIADGLDAVVTTERAGPRRRVRSVVSIEQGKLYTRWHVGSSSSSSSSGPSGLRSRELPAAS